MHRIPPIGQNMSAHEVATSGQTFSYAHKRKPHRRLTLVLAAMGVCGLLGMGAYSMLDLTKELDTLFTVFRTAVQLNVDHISGQQLMEGSIRGMLQELDPYADFIPKNHVSQFQFLTTGTYTGIGAMIRKADSLTMIAESYEGSPAAIAGLKAGDTLLRIGNQSVKGLPLDSVSAMLRGEAGSVFTVDIRRIAHKETLQLQIKRANVQIPAVTYSSALGDGVVYVKLAGFREHCAEEVKEAILSHTPKNELPKGIILDLRGNTGGLLEEAISLLSYFIPEGTKVLEVRGRGGEALQEKLTHGKCYFEQVPLVVLVDRGSASSSEIVSGALQDMDRALLIGQRTFGKGLVQTTFPMPYGDILKITTAKYYTPSGRCIQSVDYTHRDKNGAVGEIPDSLMQAFTTKSGRTVVDGGGIYPDLTVENEDLGVFILSLAAYDAFFNYATLYTAKHENISPVSEFTLTDADIKEFLAYLHEHDYPKKTPFYIGFANLEKQYAGDQSIAAIAPQLQELRKSIERQFDTLFWANQQQLRTFLKAEICSRYYYTAGRLEVEVDTDPEVAHAKEILLDLPRYKELLSHAPKDPRLEQFYKYRYGAHYADSVAVAH